LRKGDTLFLEGTPGEGVFILASGEVQLVKTSEEGKEIVIRTVERGEIFAEAVLFEKESYPVTARALAAGTVYLIPRRVFLHLFEDEGFRTDFMAGTMQRLRYLTDRILELSTANAEARLFAFLHDRYGDRHSYTLALSKKDIAAAIGVTPETLSRLIVRLAARGVMTWQGKKIVMSPRSSDRSLT